MIKGSPLFKIFFISLFTIGLFHPAFGQDIQIKTSVDRTRVGLNQNFTVTIEVTGDKADNIANPKIPDLNKFAAYLGSSGTSQNIQIINGRMSVSKSYSYIYRATALGKFTIPEVVIQYKGKEYRSQPVEIEVVKAPKQQSQRQQRRNPSSSIDQADAQLIDENLYLKAIVNRRNVYVNEPVILSYKIYTRVSVTQYAINKLPNTAGFWVEEYEVGNQPQTYEEYIDGKKFLVAEIKKMALFPTDAGKKKIGPMEIECNVRVQTRRRSIFDSFFDDPFFGRTVRKLINSNPITINVMPLPETGKPSHFSGLVGNFTINASVDKMHVKANEAISLKIEIAGRGNVKMIPEPVLELPADFERYPPKVSEKINRNTGGVSGSKTFEYVLIPRHAGAQKIKPVTFSYFDVRERRYKTIRTKEIVVNVEKSDEQFVAISSGHSKEDVKYLGQDIRFIQLESPKFHKINSYFYNSFYFILILIFPLIAIGTAFGYRRHLDKLSGNVAYARSRRANQMAMKRLHKAKKLLSEKTQKEFYAEVSNALVGFLADKLNISAAGIITDEVENLMKKRGIDPQVISQYLSCLQTCDYQRFAPSTSKIEEMNAFFEQAKKAIVALEKVM